MNRKQNYLNRYWDPNKHIFADQTIPCFICSNDYPIDEFVEELCQRINAEIIVTNYKDFFLDYKAICTKTLKYVSAFENGIDIILESEYYRQSQIYPLNCYNEKCLYDFVQIIEANVRIRAKKNDGMISNLAKYRLKKWNKKLSKLLSLEVIMDIEIGGRLCFYIKRTPKSYLTHNEIINKIRASNLMDTSIFSEYAFLAYHGEYIKY